MSVNGAIVPVYVCACVCASPLSLCVVMVWPKVSLTSRVKYCFGQQRMRRRKLLMSCVSTLTYSYTHIVRERGGERDRNMCVVACSVCMCVREREDED